ncbi:DUF6314 family protein [Amycolatopsis solani]|uniref:DUF6314 family protein n=1 Tax=Amycolatopsis solani TaxID=3028615 RepID=UPI0025AF4022|nr:DUF6314 family protein [Amycolatopsis sp. MEP2-6]
MEYWPVPDLAAHFAGAWRLDREILTAGGEVAGEVTGTATFTEEDGDLVYREAGEMRLGTYTGPVTRTLRYRPTAPGRADVHFDHGGFFHELDLRAGHWATDHPSRADLYRGSYQVLDARRWRQEWAVRGPAKDHLIVTRFTRSTG